MWNKHTAATPPLSHAATQPLSHAAQVCKFHGIRIFVACSNCAKYNGVETFVCLFVVEIIFMAGSLGPCAANSGLAASKNEKHIKKVMRIKLFAEFQDRSS